MEKINWGILGLGEIAHKFSKGFFETTNAKLLAVASKDLEKTKNLKISLKLNQNIYLIVMKI